LLDSFVQGLTRPNALRENAATFGPTNPTQQGFTDWDDFIGFMATHPADSALNAGTFSRAHSTTGGVAVWEALAADQDWLNANNIAFTADMIDGRGNVMGITYAQVRAAFTNMSNSPGWLEGQGSEVQDALSRQGWLDRRLGSIEAAPVTSTNSAAFMQEAEAQLQQELAAALTTATQAFNAASTALSNTADSNVALGTAVTNLSNAQSTLLSAQLAYDDATARRGTESAALAAALDVLTTRQQELALAQALNGLGAGISGITSAAHSTAMGNASDAFSNAMSAFTSTAAVTGASAATAASLEALSNLITTASNAMSTLATMGPGEAMTSGTSAALSAAVSVASANVSGASAQAIIHSTNFYQAGIRVSGLSNAQHSVASATGNHILAVNHSAVSTALSGASGALSEVTYFYDEGPATPDIALRAQTLANNAAQAEANAVARWEAFVNQELTADTEIVHVDRWVPREAERERGVALWFQIGANSGQGISVEIGSMSTGTLFGREGANHSAERRIVDVLDIFGYNVQDGLGSNYGHTIADNAVDTLLEALDAALAITTRQRSELGAVQNRLEFAIENLDISSENLSAANSRIRDADMAREMMQLTQANVLQQAAISMLAQANQAPQSVLQLLG
jgi:flagellin-like hook-associated protein FlgL